MLEFSVFTYLWRVFRVIFHLRHLEMQKIWLRLPHTVQPCVNIAKMNRKPISLYCRQVSTSSRRDPGSYSQTKFPFTDSLHSFSHAYGIALLMTSSAATSSDVTGLCIACFAHVTVPTAVSKPPAPIARYTKT